MQIYTITIEIDGELCFRILPSFICYSEQCCVCGWFTNESSFCSNDQTRNYTQVFIQLHSKSSLYLFSLPISLQIRHIHSTWKLIRYRGDSCFCQRIFCCNMLGERQQLEFVHITININKLKLDGSFQVCFACLYKKKNQWKTIKGRLNTKKKTRNRVEMWLYISNVETQFSQSNQQIFIKIQYLDQYLMQYSKFHSNRRIIYRFDPNADICFLTGAKSIKWTVIYSIFDEIFAECMCIGYIQQLSFSILENLK